MSAKKKKHDEKAVGRLSIRRDKDGNIHSCHASEELDWLDPLCFDTVERAERGEDIDEGEGLRHPGVRLLNVFHRVQELGRALARGNTHLADGREVRELIDRLYRVTEGHSEDAMARRHLIGAVAFAAKFAADNESDDELRDRVCSDRRFSEQDAERLATHPAEIALAVRLWRRGPGRPSRDEPKGSKWKALAELSRLMGLPAVDEKALEQIWKSNDTIDLTPLGCQSSDN